MQRGHRGSTTPMDFEWSTSTGPVDPSSPFMNIEHQQQHQQHQQYQLQSAKKRSHSVLDSPSKNGFATPSRLREPDNRAFYFAQDGSTTKPLPLPPHVQNAWEPRTPASNYDFSSGGETPNTPGQDSDAPTPDTHLADKTSKAKKARPRESWFKRLVSSPSPTKDSERECERERERDRDRHYSHKAENRIQKRRSERSERARSKKRTLQDIDMDDSDREQAIVTAAAVATTSSSTTTPTTTTTTTNPKTYAMSIAGFLHWVEAHPYLPSVLSFYMQLLVNLFLASMFVYIIWSAWCGVMADVDIASSKHMSEVMVEIAACAKQYSDNNCEPGRRNPYMEKVCGTWETCMSRDPRKVARASVTAKTFAIIFNSFVDEFSYKSMVFTAIIIFGGFNLSNWAFGLLRHQQQQPQRQSTPNPSDFMPQTPHRVPSNSYLESNQSNQQQNWQQYTPYQTPYGAMRHIEPPPLQHTQSLPALPMVAQEGADMLESRKTPRRKGIFR
ncbi:Di-sulfide bridge nucleocytoplasmic transport domain-containing protein [Phaeosphaeriaceae sp. PMI808]|nr:Di-sulfide bridge nucleocytoplasmic transport domain-containing protein [Phaeosphaeriaceae sp. PMI808]